jgi:hypothetical protein
MKIMLTKTTAKKTVTAATAKKPAAKKPATPKTKKAAYTQDEIALRAYFISEKRQRLGLHGDSHSDWIEAERQLAAESRPTAVAKKA